MLAMWRWQSGADNALNNYLIRRTKIAAGASRYCSNGHRSINQARCLLFSTKGPRSRGLALVRCTLPSAPQRPCRLQRVDRGGEGGVSLQSFDAVSGIMGTAACGSCVSDRSKPLGLGRGRAGGILTHSGCSHWARIAASVIAACHGARVGVRVNGQGPGYDRTTLDVKVRTFQRECGWRGRRTRAPSRFGSCRRSRGAVRLGWSEERGWRKTSEPTQNTKDSN